MPNGNSSPTRRTVVKKFGAVGVGIAAVGQVSGQERSQREEMDLEEFQGALEERYGQREARAVVAIVSRYAKSVRQNRVDEQAAFESAAEDIIEHPQITDFSEDLQQHLNRKEVVGTQRHEVNRADIEVTKLSSQSTRSVSLINGETGSDTSPVTGEADTSYSTSKDRIEEFTRASGYGSATGWARIYGYVEILEDSGGWADITADYFRKGTTTSTTGSAQTEISIFVEDSSFIKETIESPGWANGTTTGTAQFHLDPDVLYTVGVEVRGDVSAIGGYNYSDYGTTGADASSRHVEVNDLTIEF